MTAIPVLTVPPIAQLRPLGLTTEIADGGRPRSAIVRPSSGRYDVLTGQLQDAVLRVTGVSVPVVADQASPRDLAPGCSLICLGNRSTNACIRQLYDLFFTFLDLKYPGPGGCVLQSLHNPFGDGRNVVFVGGSDDGGVEMAADLLIEKLRQAGGGPGQLALGWLHEVRLGNGYRPPSDVRRMEIWEASKGYGNRGYFGWNSLPCNFLGFYQEYGDR